LHFLDPIDLSCWKARLDKLVTAGGNGRPTQCFIRGGIILPPPPALLLNAIPHQTFCYQQTIYHFSILGIVWSLFVDGPPTDEFLKNALRQSDASCFIFDRATPARVLTSILKPRYCKSSCQSTYQASGVEEYKNDLNLVEKPETYTMNE
jgi:hypothetical protein